SEAYIPRDGYWVNLTTIYKIEDFSSTLCICSQNYNLYEMKHYIDKVSDFQVFHQHVDRYTYNDKGEVTGNLEIEDCVINPRMYRASHHYNYINSQLHV
ncbi:MAG: hypothetical protein ACRDBG_02465, partial [Waterburya sp.]